MAKKKDGKVYAFTDATGKTHFDISDAAHVRNALARLDQSPYGAKAKAKVLAAAKRFGISVDEKAAAKNAKKSKSLKKPKKD